MINEIFSYIYIESIDFRMLKTPLGPKNLSKEDAKKSST